MPAAWIQLKFLFFGILWGPEYRVHPRLCPKPCTTFEWRSSSPPLSAFAFHLLTSLTLQVQRQSWRMDLYNLLTAYLPACCKDEPLCPVVLRGLSLRFTTCSGLHVVHKVMLLHKLGGFLQGLDGPLQQQPRRYSASPLHPASYLKQPSTEEQLTMSSVELLPFLSFYVFVQKRSRKCFVIVRNSKKKDIAKTK